MDFLGDFAWAAAAWNITQAVLAFADNHPAVIIVVAGAAGLVALHKAPGAFRLNKIASLGLVAAVLIALIFEGIKMIMAPAIQPALGDGAHPAAVERGASDYVERPWEDRIGGP